MVTKKGLKMPYNPYPFGPFFVKQVNREQLLLCPMMKLV